MVKLIVYSLIKGLFTVVNSQSIMAAKQNLIRKVAFTLAEVLIVIGIIGVVAEMTIPALINQVSNAAQASQVKKFYSEFQQGISTYMQNTGCADVSCTSLFTGLTTDAAQQAVMKTAVPNIFRLRYNYGYNSASLSSYSTRYLAASTVASSKPFYNGYAVLTKDNFLISIQDTDAGNCASHSANVNDTRLKNYCSVIIVDVNGPDSPNRIGKDTFYFYLGNDGFIYPANSIEYARMASDAVSVTADANYWPNAATCGTRASATIPAGQIGLGCAARLMENNWEFDYN